MSDASHMKSHFKDFKMISKIVKIIFWRCYRFYSFSITLFLFSSIQKPFENSSSSQSYNFLSLFTLLIHLMVDPYQYLDQVGQTLHLYICEPLAGAYKSSFQEEAYLRAFGIYKMTSLTVSLNCKLGQNLLSWQFLLAL